MREVLHLTADDLRHVPWKNGRGFTDELALWPEHAAFERNAFDWRISKARVDDAGPFSLFEGFDRILVVTDGDGLLLTHGDRAARARLRRFEPYRFAGDWPTHAELTDGPVADFNVVTRRGSAQASVEVLKLHRRRARETPGAGHAFLHVLTGDAVARVTGEEEPFVLGPRESLWARAITDNDEIEVAGQSDDCIVLVVRIAIDTPDHELG